MPKEEMILSKPLINTELPKRIAHIIQTIILTHIIAQIRTNTPGITSPILNHIMILFLIIMVTMIIMISKDLMKKN
jgi:hypothetical protein